MKWKYQEHYNSFFFIRYRKIDSTWVDFFCLKEFLLLFCNKYGEIRKVNRNCLK